MKGTGAFILPQRFSHAKASTRKSKIKLPTSPPSSIEFFAYSFAPSRLRGSLQTQQTPLAHPPQMSLASSRITAPMS
jgi:hypothetical protein